MNEAGGLVLHILKTLGAEGLMLLLLAAPTAVMVLIYLDHRRSERERTETIRDDAEHRIRWIEEREKNDRQHLEQLETIKGLHQDELNRMHDEFVGIITQQQARFERVVKQYENNVVLVENYQKLAGDLAGIITMNTQILTKLVAQVESNQTCPIIRDGATKHGL